jgi:ABC-type uncharacterized transport system auxiliary subunit
MRTLATVLCLALAGCGANTYTPVTRYALDPDIQVEQAAPTGQSIGLRPLDTPPAYGQRVALLEDGQVLRLADDAEWAELPEGVTRRALIDALVATGAFTDAGRARDLPRPDWVLTGTLREFVVDTTASPWRARVELRLAVRRPIESTLLWQEDLSAEAPLRRNAVAAAPDAMDAAVADAAGRAAVAIAAALAGVNE